MAKWYLFAGCCVVAVVSMGIELGWKPLDILIALTWVGTSSTVAVYLSHR